LLRVSGARYVFIVAATRPARTFIEQFIDQTSRRMATEPSIVARTLAMNSSSQSMVSRLLVQG
jgi:hypothetical protein